MSGELKVALTVLVWACTLCAWRRFHKFLDGFEGGRVRRGK